MSNSLQSHGLQHARLPCPSPTPGLLKLVSIKLVMPSNHPSSVIPISSCLHSFPASGSFPVSQLFASGGQSIRFSASASVLPVNIQDWFPLLLLFCLFVFARCFYWCYQFSSVQSLSHVRLLVTAWTAACQGSLSITNCWNLPKPMSTELVMPSNHPILCCPLLLLPSIFPSIRVLSNESALCIRWPKYWSFSFNISSSTEHPGLISSRLDWLDLLAVQGTLKSPLQHHSSKASIPRCSAFFTVQLSHPYMTNGKTIALTRWTFVD